MIKTKPMVLRAIAVLILLCVDLSTYADKNDFNVKDVKLIYQFNDLHRQQLLKLFKKEWWSKDRSIENVNTILKNTNITIGLVNKNNGELIGFGRALTDKLYFAYIDDIIIHSDYRNLGLSKMLMTKIIEHPDISELSSIELICEEKMRNFYKQFGFEDYAGAIAMYKPKTSNTTN